MRTAENNTRVLIIEGERSVRESLLAVCRSAGLEAEAVSNAPEAIKRLTEENYTVALLDWNLPGSACLELLDYLERNNLNMEPILTGFRSSEASARQVAEKKGWLFLIKPFESLKALPEQIAQLALRPTAVKESLDSFYGIVGRSPQMQEVYDLIDSIRASDSNVLILGASGTGKEMIAQAIHQSSRRHNKPFIVINCAALPETLLESELFGHQKGSFTGAVADKKGLFKEADHGTVFLDEIGEIPASIQVKLLRILQSGDFRPLGGSENWHVDVRIIAATHQNLPQLIREGRFREDLFYRLNVISLNLPSLHERTGDIPLLAYSFLKKYAARSGKKVEHISVDAMKILQQKHWTGHVRELENVIERAVVLSEDDTLGARDLPPELLKTVFYVQEEGGEEPLSHLSYQAAKEKALDLFHRQYFQGLLEKAKGNISLAAAQAGMDRSNFKKILKKSGFNIKTMKKGIS